MYEIVSYFIVHSFSAFNWSVFRVTILNFFSASVTFRYGETCRVDKNPAQQGTRHPRHSKLPTKNVHKHEQQQHLVEDREWAHQAPEPQKTRQKEGGQGSERYSKEKE